MARTTVNCTHPDRDHSLIFSMGVVLDFLDHDGCLYSTTGIANPSLQTPGAALRASQPGFPAYRPSPYPPPVSPQPTFNLKPLANLLSAVAGKVLHLLAWVQDWPDWDSYLK